MLSWAQTHIYLRSIAVIREQVQECLNEDIVYAYQNGSLFLHPMKYVIRVTA